MGTNIGPVREILGNSEHVLRGLNPIHCEAGLPTRACFLLSANDRPDDGPSYGIHEAPADQVHISPLGARQGISVEAFLSVLPSREYGVARLNVGRALQEVVGRAMVFVQKDDEKWLQHAAAHAMITGYQTLGNQIRKDLQRYLAKLAAEAVLKPPGEKPK